MVNSMVNYHAKSKRFIYSTEAMKSWPLNINFQSITIVI